MWTLLRLLCHSVCCRHPAACAFPCAACLLADPLICCLPALQLLFPGAEPDFDGETTGEGGCVDAGVPAAVWHQQRADSRAATPPSPAAGEDLVEASGKLHVLDRLLRKLKQRGHRVVLFSQVGGGCLCGLDAGRSCWLRVA